MNWDELNEKHRNQWGDFTVESDAAWQKINNDHIAMRAAFGNKEHEIPNSVHERIERDTNEWKQEWGIKGTKSRELSSRQQQEVDTFAKQEKFKAKFQSKSVNSKDKDNGPDKDD